MNAVSNPANYPSSATDNDFVLVKPDGTIVAEDDVDVEITTDAQGTAKIGLRARDFGGATRIFVRDAPGQIIAALSVPGDSDWDQIADAWEVKMAERWSRQYGEAGLTTQQALNKFARDTDGELEDPDGTLSDRLVAQKDQGDAHTVWEEYRGYFLDGGGLNASGGNPHLGGHIRLDPARKELLVEVDTAATLNNVPEGGLPNILDGAAKVFSNVDRGAGIYLYYLMDQTTLNLPLDTVDELLKIMNKLAETRNNQLKSDFLHLLIIDHGTKDAFRAAAGTPEDLNFPIEQRGSVIATTDMHTIYPEEDRPKQDEAFMTVIAHELTHQLINKRDSGAFDALEHTIDGNQNGTSHEDDDKACLMYNL